MSHSHTQHKVAPQPGQKTVAAYVTGLILCLLLTLAAFKLVSMHLAGQAVLSTIGTYIALGVLAVIQLFVQVVCFLRLNASEEGRWELMPFLFTLFVVGVVVCGSLWIMISLNYNMMH